MQLNFYEHRKRGFQTMTMKETFLANLGGNDRLVYMCRV